MNTKKIHQIFQILPLIFVALGCGGLSQDEVTILCDRGYQNFDEILVFLIVPKAINVKNRNKRLVTVSLYTGLVYITNLPHQVCYSAHILVVAESLRIFHNPKNL